MTALTADAIRLFTAFVVVAAIVTIAVVLATWTPAAEDDNPQTGDGAGGPPAPEGAVPEAGAMAMPAPSSSTTAALHRAQTAWFPDRSEWDQQ